MRITVGGVLLFAGAGAVAAVVFLPNSNTYIQSIREKVNTSLGLFRSASSSSTTAESPLIPEPAEPQAPPPPIPVAEPPQAVIPTAPVPVEPVVEEPKPEVKKKTRTRRRPKKKPTSAKATVGKAATKKTAPAKTAAAAAPAAPAPKKSGGSLVGSEVILTLNTGRDVRGILQSQDAVGYKVELPGLGVFTYPLQNVKSIRASE